MCGRHKTARCQMIPCRFWADWSDGEWAAQARFTAIKTECGIGGGFADLDTEALKRHPQRIAVI